MNSHSLFAPVVPCWAAAGNWIKVVERVPVRIALDPQELEAHPLRIVLSMDADTSIKDENVGIYHAGAQKAGHDAGSSPKLQ